MKGGSNARHVSEPIASILVGIFLEFAKNPVHEQRIYEEVRNLDVRDVKALSAAQHLEAVITETLRLYPVLLTGGNRKTQKDGIIIGGTYIPPYTTIVAPRYSISRCECSNPALSSHLGLYTSTDWFSGGRF
jgi:cytochrome P450